MGGGLVDDDDAADPLRPPVVVERFGAAADLQSTRRLRVIGNDQGDGGLHRPVNREAEDEVVRGPVGAVEVGEGDVPLGVS